MTVNKVTLLPLRSAAAPALAPRPALPRISRAIRGPALWGFALIVIFLGGFIAWAVLVPIASGAVASGVIIPDGNRRIIQHYEGGIIAEILVRDGDRVAAGQPVIVLEDRLAKANHDALMAEYLTAMAVTARLTAESTHTTTIIFPPELMTDTVQTRAIRQDQQAIFTRRQEYLAAQKSILQARDQQLTAQRTALEAQKQSIDDQTALNQEELQAKQALLDNGLSTMSQVMDLRRQAASLVGEAGRLAGTLSELGDKRAEIALQLLSLEAERADEVAQNTDTARAALAKAQEQINVSKDVLQRTVLTAPVSGKVVNSRFMSPGGVIRSAEPIMEIVPDQERLMIDARISVVDIDSVHSGMAAVVRLTALASYRLPKIEGRVTSVSGDRITDPATGQVYYQVRIEVSPESLQRIGEVELVPGMPADVLLVTTTRTMAAYLFEPIIAAFNRSFHEA